MRSMLEMNSLRILIFETLVLLLIGIPGVSKAEPALSEKDISKIIESEKGSGSIDNKDTAIDDFDGSEDEDSGEAEQYSDDGGDEAEGDDEEDESDLDIGDMIRKEGL